MFPAIFALAKHLLPNPPRSIAVYAINTTFIYAENQVGSSFSLSPFLYYLTPFTIINYYIQHKYLQLNKRTI